MVGGEGECGAGVDERGAGCEGLCAEDEGDGGWICSGGDGG